MTNFKELISIVTPVYNEEDVIAEYYKRISKVLSSLSDDYDFEIIFTDNCSTDNTFPELEKLAAKDRRISVYRFSKNFGYQKSIWMGYAKSNGSAAIEFDADLQDPPEMLSEMLSCRKKGYKIVYGIRKDRKESVFINGLRKVFYRLVRIISDYDIPNDAGDFMLLDRDVIENLKEVRLCDPYLRGIIFGFGYSRKGIEYSRDQRVAGVSKFPLSKMIKLATDAIINTSIFPLRIASIIGATMGALSMCAAVWFIIDKLFLNPELPKGVTAILVLVLVSIAINAFLIGIVGEYIGKIYRQVSSHNTVPIVEKEINHSRNSIEQKQC